MRRAKPRREPLILFTPYRAVQAEGARVGITSCRLCGAAIIIDNADGITADQIHEQWHRSRGDLKKLNLGSP